MTSVRPGPGLRTASQTSDLVPMRLRPASASSGRNCAGCAEWSTVRRPGRHPVKRSAVAPRPLRPGVIGAVLCGLTARLTVLLSLFSAFRSTGRSAPSNLHESREETFTAYQCCRRPRSKLDNLWTDDFAREAVRSSGDDVPAVSSIAMVHVDWLQTSLCHRDSHPDGG